jgi:hypothetical protein
MIFSLDVRRARKGDCLLLHFGSHDKPGLVMIDGGPQNVYAPHLKPRLLDIRKARKLTKEEPLPVDLLMVSHVDDDHIQGILDLTRELTTASGPPLVRVLSLWHNSFDDIIGNTPEELTAALSSAGLGTASLDAGLPALADLPSNEDDEVVHSSLMVLTSIEQGHRLRDDAEKLEFPRNPEFDGKLIVAPKKDVPVAEGLTFTVAGPMKAEIKELQKKHDDWLKEQKKKKRTGGAALAAYVDKSVPNLSSIVVLAKVGNKLMLLTGDARGDKILEGLQLAGALKPGKKMHVDVLKVPHHGSANNLADDFFERISADHYVFSGDGEHGNPERETLEMLFRARGSEPFEIHLTYPVEEIDVARKADWNKEQAKEKQRQKTGGKKPRADWSPAKHGLVAFFKKHKLAKNQKVSVVAEKEPHVIDLLEPLGY